MLKVFYIIALFHLISSMEAASSEPTALRIKVNENEKLPYDPSNSGFSILAFYNGVLGRLLTVNDSLDTEPALLESARFDFKQKAYKLKLKENLRFHNGRVVSAVDLEFSLARHFLGRGRADPIAVLRNIDGIEALKSGDPFRPGMVRGLRVLDARTLEVKLSRPNPAFLYALAEGWVSLVPQEELMPDYFTWKSKPVGAGPYQVSKIDDLNCKVELTRAAQTGLGPERVIFDCVKNSKNVDLMFFVENKVLTSGLDRRMQDKPIGFTGLFFNSKNPLANNLNFRKALRSLVDQTEFALVDSSRRPLFEVLTGQFYGRIRPKTVRDLGEAKLLLARVPAALLKRPIKIQGKSAKSHESEPDTDLEILSKQMQSLGLQTEIVPSESPTLLDGDHETVFKLDDRGTAFIDPLVIFQAFRKPAFLSRFMVGDLKQFDQLLDNAAHSESLDVKAASIAELSRFFYDNALVVPLYERRVTYWINPKLIKSVGDWEGISFNLERFELVER